MMQMYDVIIIGGGPAGLTAGIYATRSGLKTLLLEKLIPGGQANLTDWIENYPGFPEGISGSALMKNIEQQAKKLGLEIKSEQATGVVNNKDIKIVKTEQVEYQTLTIIVATGAQPEKLGVSGEDKLIGKGISYCATCDGPLFRDRNLMVVGGGNAALEEALLLTKFAKKVTIVHRRAELRASKILQDRAFNNQKVDFIWDSVVQEIIGEKKVESIKIKNLKNNEGQTISIDGIFVFIGTKPDTEFVQNIVKMDKAGYIITDENMVSSCDGIYACGDARKRVLKQVITACAEGAIAAVSAAQYVDNLKHK